MVSERVVDDNLEWPGGGKRHRRVKERQPDSQSCRKSVRQQQRAGPAGQAQVDSPTIDLSARELALAEVFLRHPGQVLSREQLLSHVWGYDYDPGSNVVEVYVRYLRNELGPDRIATIRGAGYRLVRESLV